MGSFDKLTTLNYISNHKVVPVFYDPDIEIVKNLDKEHVKFSQKDNKIFSVCSTNIDKHEQFFLQL